VTQNNPTRKISEFLSLVLPVSSGDAVSFLKRYFSNTSWLLFEKVFASLVSFWVGVYVIRYLGPTHYGILSYALSFVAMFSGIASLAYSGIVIRDLVHSEEERDELLGTSFVLKLAGALLVLILVSIVIAIIPNDRVTNWSILIIAGAPIFRSLDVIDFYFQSKVLSKYPVWVRCVSMVVSSGLKLLLIFLRAPLIWFVVVIAMESVVIASGLVLVFMSHKLKVNWSRFKKQLALRVLRDSWPLMLSSILVSVYMRVDQVMIKNMLDAEAVGIYAVAVYMTEIWYFLPAIVMGSLFPGMVNVRENDHKLYMEGLQKLHDVFFLIAIGIGLVVTLCSSKIINLLFGVSFMEARIPLAIYIWSVVFMFQTTIRGQFLIIENKQQIGLWFRIFTTMVSIGLSLLLIPRYGIVGAAFATLISYGLPIYVGSIFHPLLRLNLGMCLKSYLAPFRLLRFLLSAIRGRRAYFFRV